MIAWLQGLIIEKEPPVVIINVNGVGYRVETSMNTFFNLPEVGQNTTLQIHTVIREDAYLLYGFGDKTERSLFVQLIKVNGVGPKVALSILSSLSPGLLVQTIENQDVSSLVKVPGVGKKTAQRLLIDLKELKVEGDMSLIEAQANQSAANAQQEAISALLTLGYKQHEASKAVKLSPPELSCEDMIRQALKQLS